MHFTNNFEVNKHTCQNKVLFSEKGSIFVLFGDGFLAVLLFFVLYNARAQLKLA